MSRAPIRCRTRRIAPARRWRGHPIPWLLAVAFALNVAALVIPFLDLRRGFSSETYSLPRSIVLLWDKGLYVLALVIVAFSVCFPFLKLSVLFGIVLGLVHPRRSRVWLAFVERFGKWSMLDVFIVCLMIALANDQFLIGATPRVGILCFTLAIVLAMVCSAWMRHELVGAVRLASLPQRSIAWMAGGELAVLLIVVLVLCVPFLEIDDWLLVDRPVSILGAVQGLWATGARTLSCVVAFFLAILPLAGSGLSFAAWIRHRAGRPTQALRGLRILVGRWEMLDVFAVSLLIFLIEGRSFVRTDLAWGAFLLALLLALYWPISASFRRRLGA